MKLTDEIARHIMDVQQGDNWTDVNIETGLKDVTLSEAVFITKASANTIAALLHHITFYNEVVLERLLGNDPVIIAANGFDVPVLSNENEWERLKLRSLESAQKLGEEVKKLPEEKLFIPILPNKSTVYKTLHGVVEHSHYHLGQIVLLKNLIRKGT